MVEIKASGKFIGEKLEVIASLNDDGAMIVKFDGKGNNFLRKRLIKLLKKRFVIAGSYVPPEVFSSINLYFVLQEHFFDEKADKVEVVKGNVDEMPNDGKVY